MARIYLNDLFMPLNPLIERVLRSRFHWPLSIAMAVVAWDGRRSGKRFSTPVGYQWGGDAVVVLISKPATKQWWRNFQSPWPADLVFKGRVRATMGEELPPGSPAFFEACEETLRRLPFMGGQLGGVRYRRNEGLDYEQRKRLEEHARAIRFEFLD